MVIKEEKSSSTEIKETETVPEVTDYFANLDFSNVEVNLEAMLKNGVHFGHQKSRRDPRMDKYVFTTRKGINIIDLQKTADKLQEAIEFVKRVRQSGKNILFVSTKKQMKDLVQSAAKRTEMPYVVERWLGGTFTNFKVIKGRTKYLRDSQEMLAKGEFKKYTKFEQMKKAEELEKMEKKMGGIKMMDEMPGAVFVIDIKEDLLAVKEAHKVGIPVIALADTNNNPTEVDYPIPSNDDAVSSVKLIIGYLCKAIIETKPQATAEKKKPAVRLGI